MNKFTEDYYMRGPETGLSNYTNYRWMPELTLPLAKMVKKIMGINLWETVLDYGCARGFLVKALRLLDVEAYGCDISEWAIKNCDPDVVNYVGWDYDYRTYDHVFCKDVLEHVPQNDLDIILPKLFSLTTKSLLFIVPLAEEEGGKYIYPDDEKDATHIHRKTLLGWMNLIEKYTKDFVIYGSLYIPVLKLSVNKYPGSAGFIHCVNIKGDL